MVTEGLDHLNELNRNLWSMAKSLVMLFNSTLVLSYLSYSLWTQVAAVSAGAYFFRIANKLN